jgi:hypothetical protein
MVRCKWLQKETLVASIGSFVHPKLPLGDTIFAPCGLGQVCFWTFMGMTKPDRIWLHLVTTLDNNGMLTNKQMGLGNSRTHIQEL